MNKYKVKCLDAKYDENLGVIVLNCWFFVLSKQRIVIFNKSDFHFKKVGVEPPNNEMYKTASILKGKEFNLIVEDDPDMKKLSKEEEKKFFNEFSNQISEELTKTCDGLSDDTGQIQRHLGRMIDQGKIDVNKLIQSEMAIKAKLGGI